MTEYFPGKKIKRNKKNNQVNVCVWGEERGRGRGERERAQVVLRCCRDCVGILNSVSILKSPLCEVMNSYDRDNCMVVITQNIVLKKEKKKQTPNTKNKKTNTTTHCSTQHTSSIFDRVIHPVGVWGSQGGK